MTRRRRNEAGVVLATVVIFYLLLFSSIATFARRATLDANVVHNRDAAMRAEALARGSIQVAMALILEDLLRDQESDLPAESLFDVWAETDELGLPVPEDAELNLHIEDAQAQLNLNGLIDAEGKPIDAAVAVLLEAILEKVVDEMPGPPGEKNYDPGELAENLIDWMDEDETRQDGGLEDDYYQRQNPRYRAANRPLLSRDELRLVEGFDTALVRALEPYIGIYPLVGSEGINPNTAPSWVLALMFQKEAVGQDRLAGEDVVERVVKLREDDLLCPKEIDHTDCLNLSEEVPETDTLFPPPTFGSHVFRVRAEARVGEVRRTLEVVIDRADPQEPQVLDWRMR